MNDEELREQLKRLDPMHPGVPVESATRSSSKARMEQIMNTPLIEKEDSLSSSIPETPITGSRRQRSWFQLATVAAAAAILAIGGAVVLADRGDDAGTQVAAGPPIELSLGDGNAMSSCIMFDVAFLANMSPAFAGTATSVEGDLVTLTVDRWYAGGDASSVVLRGADESPALIGGIEFEVGQQYLITASEGTVNLCGYSGPATPQLTEAFDAAFGS